MHCCKRTIRQDSAMRRLKILAESSSQRPVPARECRHSAGQGRNVKQGEKSIPVAPPSVVMRWQRSERHRLSLLAS